MDDSTREPSNQEFRVSISGAELPPEIVQTISRAVQKAVLIEVAGLDLRPGYAVRLIGNGGTQGMELIAEQGGPRS
jgi:hypothetical protein